MLREQFRIQETWAASKRWSVDTGFVHAAFKNFRHPVIESLNLRFTGTVEADANTIESYAHHFFLGESIKMADERGDRIDCSMRGLRIVAQQELGNRFQDPADQASSTNTSYEVNLPITFHPARSARPNDYLMTVAEFLESDFIWKMASAAPFTSGILASGTCELQANVRENYTQDAPSRLQIIEVSAEKAEEIFSIDGALRYALLYANSTDQDLTSLATWTEVDSRTLRLSDMPTSALKYIAQHNQLDLDATNDEVTRNRVIPLVVPDFDQHFTQLYDHSGRLHVKLQAALPSGGRLLTVSVTPRSDQQTARSLGYGSVAELNAAIAAGQVEVVTAKGSKPIAEVGLKMASLAPLRRKGV
jgi:hypothetical protein